MLIHQKKAFLKKESLEYFSKISTYDQIKIYMHITINKIMNRIQRILYTYILYILAYFLENFYIGELLQNHIIMLLIRNSDSYRIRNNK